MQRIILFTVKKKTGRLDNIIYSYKVHTQTTRPRTVVAVSHFLGHDVRVHAVDLDDGVSKAKRLALLGLQLGNLSQSQTSGHLDAK